MKIYTLKHIETPRLLISPVQLGDEIELNKAVNRSLLSLQRWMPWSKDPSLKTTREFVQKSVYNWESKKSHDFPMVVIHKESNKIISGSGYNEKSDITKPYFEIGYWIDSEYEGRGLVTEFVNALTRYALEELSATRVQICTQVGNSKSIAVAKRCGFTLEATLKNNCIDCISGLPADSLLFACCNISELPILSVKWQHGNPKTKTNIQLPSKATSSHPIQLPTLMTRRLKLSPPKANDTEPLHEALMASLNKVSPWFSWAKPTLTREQLLHHIQEATEAAKDIQAHDHLFYLVWNRNEKALLGEVWLKVIDWILPCMTINYWFDTRNSGHGYATEAVAKLIQYTFSELKARRIQLHISETNDRSLRLAKRLGFAFEGNLKNHSKNFVTNDLTATKLFAMTSLNQMHPIDDEEYS